MRFKQYLPDKMKRGSEQVVEPQGQTLLSVSSSTKQICVSDIDQLLVNLLFDCNITACSQVLKHSGFRNSAEKSTGPRSFPQELTPPHFKKLLFQTSRFRVLATRNVPSVICSHASHYFVFPSTSLVVLKCTFVYYGYKSQ